MTKKKYDAMVEKSCSECGRVFVPAPYHIYKEQGNKIFCSYSCHTKYRREQEKNTNRRRIMFRAKRERK